MGREKRAKLLIETLRPIRDEELIYRDLVVSTAESQFLQQRSLKNRQKKIERKEGRKEEEKEQEGTRTRSCPSYCYVLETPASGRKRNQRNFGRSRRASHYSIPATLSYSASASSSLY